MRHRIALRSANHCILRDHRGLSTVEYIVLLVLVVAACVGLWVSFGGKLQDKINASNAKMDEVQVGDGKTK